MNKHTRLCAVLAGFGLLDVAYIDFVAGPALFRTADASESSPPLAVPVPAPEPLIAAASASPPAAEPEGEASFEDVWLIKFPETGQVTLGANALAELKRLSERLSPSHELRIRVIGHADQRGDPATNYRLGALRALAVAEQLQRAGFGPDQIDVSSLGDRAPLTAGSDTDAWAENRRAEIVIQARRSRKKP